MNDLIEKREIGNYLIEIYQDNDAVCPIQKWDMTGMIGRYLFEYQHTSMLNRNCNYKDLFEDNKHSLEDAIKEIAIKYVDQKDIVRYIKDENTDGIKLSYEGYWKLKGLLSSKIENDDLKSDILDLLDKDEIIKIIKKYAKDIVFKEWTSTGYCQGDYIHGVAYTTKDIFYENYDKKDEDWKELATECIDDDIECIGMWLWGDVKGYVLKEKIEFTKKYKDEDREDEYCFEWEEIDSCWGYYMETEDLIEEVIKNHGLKEE